MKNHFLQTNSGFLFRVIPVMVLLTFIDYATIGQQEIRSNENSLSLELESFYKFSNVSKVNERIYVASNQDSGFFITQPIAIPIEWLEKRTLVFPKLYVTSDDQSISIEYRFQLDNGDWSNWHFGMFDSHSSEFGSLNGKDFYTLVMVPAVLEGSEMEIQYKVKLTGHENGISGFNNYIMLSWEPEVSNPPLEYMSSMGCPCPELPFVNRLGWQCPQGMGSGWSPSITDFSHVVVHHAAGYGYTPLSAVNDIWYLHAVTWGWGDIGYNWLIDANGTIYQGRAWNGDNEQVAGAHMCSCNSNKVGICLLGNLQVNQATPAQYDALVALIGQKACMSDINVDQSSFTSYNPNNTGCTSGNLMNVIGHRDGCQQSPLYTSCPGAQFYPLMSQLRIDVENYISNCSAQSGCSSYDCCAYATNLISSNNCVFTSGTVSNATADYSWSPASCDGASDLRADVFFRFTAIEEEHTITVDPTGTLDAIVALYEGPNCNNLEEIDCIDVPGGNGITTILISTNLTPGEEYFIRIYDYGNANATSGAFNVCITHQNSNGGGFDDIVTENVQIGSNTISAGGTLSVNCDQAYNAGTSQLVDVNVGFFMSDDCDLNQGDIFLGSASSNIGSDDISDTESADLVIPEDTPSGSYYILFVADYGDLIAESVEDNNVSCVGFSVIDNSGNGTDDIVVENALVDQNVVFAGGEVAISCDQAYNQGSSVLINVNLGYYLSTDCFYNSDDDIYLDDDQSDIGSSDISDTEIASPIIPLDTDPGIYYILCVADNTEGIQESNEENNVECIQITVSGTAPDFSISNLNISNSSICPEAIALEVSFDLLNVGGSGTINELTQTGFWIVPLIEGCPMELPIQSGIYVEDFNITVDEMSDDFEHVSSYLILPLLSEGEYLLVAVADIDTDINEIEEVSNNIACAQLTVSSFATPPPAIIVGNTFLCLGGTTVLSIDNFNELNAIYNYQWSSGGEEMSIIVSEPGIYSVLAYGDGNCAGSVITEIEVFLLDEDLDNDGFPDCSDQCPDIFGQVGTLCNDGNPNTANDMINSNCECQGSIVVVLGCIDMNACNYNSAANEDDGTCIFIGDICDDNNADSMNDVINEDCQCIGTTIVEGCTDLDACNYHLLANVDNGSCIYVNEVCDDGDILTQNDMINEDCQCEGVPVIIEGCTAALACNYDPLAIVDNGSCIYIGDPCDDDNNLTVDDQISMSCECLGIVVVDITGCTASQACNYNSQATIEDGSCFFIGDVCNDNNTETINDSIDINCECTGESNAIFGCTAQNACNYAEDATIDDGSCFFIGDVCDDTNTETSNDLIDVNCECTGVANEIFGCTAQNACNYEEDATIDDGSCFFIGDVCNDNNPETSNDLIDSNCECTGVANEISGCTAQNACNYMVDATFDDGSCVFPGSPCDDQNLETANDQYDSNCICIGELIVIVFGCMDIDACNYDLDATVDDGSCLYGSSGCTDETACNYDDLAVCDDNSCMFQVSPAFDGEIFFDEYPISAIYNCPFAEGSTFTWSIEPESIGTFLTDNAGPSIVNVQWNSPGLALLCVSESFLLDNGSMCIAEPYCQEVLLSTFIEETSNIAYQIFPNPTNESITLKPARFGHVAHVTICDAVGKLVVSEMIYGTAEWSFEGLDAGVYIISISDADMVFNQRVAYVPNR